MLHFTLAFIIITAALYLGEAVSIKTKAIIPSVFVTAIIFMLGFWTIFPKDLLDQAGFQTTITYLCMFILITNMGTLLSFRELKSQWKTIVIALAGIVGICLGGLLIGGALFGWQEAIVAVPPLSGGIVASVIMSEAARAVGNEKLAILALVTFIMQGFAGYPLTSICLRKEGKRLQKLYTSGDYKIENQEVECEETTKKKLIPQLPESYNTSTSHFLRLAILSYLAYLTSTFLAGINVDINAFVIALLFGVVGTEIGFVEKQALQKANGFGFTILIIMAFVFGGLSNASPSMISELAVPLVGIITTGVLGLFIASAILSKVLGYTISMGFAVALTALYGFPPNYIITTEVIKVIAKSDGEKEYLTQEMLPKMLVGGFTTVTIVSVLIAGVLSSYVK